MKLINIDFNKYSCKVYGYNLTTKSIAVDCKGYSSKLEFDVSDEEEMLQIMNMPVLNLHEKLELLTSRFICKMQTKDIIEYSDRNWNRI